MKPLFWILAFGMTVLLFQYSLFKENGEPRSIPVMVTR
jgi:hypothetical protein